MEQAQNLIVGSCPACECMGEDSKCKGAFARRGVIKVHWECWSACNLGCKFCYRSLGDPLATVDAKRLLDAIAFGGAETIVFAGGDPTLRRDLQELLEHARGRGLGVEVQTNAHFMPDGIKNSLLSDLTDLIGLSLDGASAMSHDTLRSTRGNFSRVLGFLESCRKVDKQVIVRTVVNLRNQEEVAEIGEIISKYDNVIRWSLLEFTSIGAGYVNSADFKISREAYFDAVERARSTFSGNAKLDAFIEPAKIGAYALVTPEGFLYGTANPANGQYPIVGGMLQDHLSELAKHLPFNAELHHARYGDEYGRAPETR